MASASTAPAQSTLSTVPPPTTTAAPRSTTVPRAAGAPTSTSTVTAAPCPQNLPSSLASTGSARQLISVQAPGYDTSIATVEAWQRSGSCWTRVGGPWTGFIGQNGFSDHHVEGDGTTPTGMYPIAPMIYGNAPNPGVQGTYHQLVCGDWWDEDPHSPGYNSFQHVDCGDTPPFGGGSEALWKETAPYPSFAVVEYNTNPAVPYAGSAIFLHADIGVPTVGCVSIPLADLDQVLRWINQSSAPAIVMGPSGEIRQF